MDQYASTIYWQFSSSFRWFCIIVNGHTDILSDIRTDEQSIFYRCKDASIKKEEKRKKERKKAKERKKEKEKKKAKERKERKKEKSERKKEKERKKGRRKETEKKKTCSGVPNRCLIDP